MYLRLCLLGLVFLLLGSACAPASKTESGDSPMAAGNLPAITPMVESPRKVTPFQIKAPTAISVSTASPTLTPSASATPSPSPTPTLTPTVTPTWVWNPAGEVIVPILLYHHVSDVENLNRYYVSPTDFRAQMESLKDWGYTAIPMSLLVEALISGAELPQRPIVITFDDGDLSVYENAFPIMQELGFVGVLYIVSNRLKSEGFVNAEQLGEMIAVGWEVGSHSLSHADLTLDHDLVRSEVLQSRLDLNETLGITVTTFAYPFGTMDPYVATKVQNYGYRAAAGLGKSWKHTWSTLYYLSRIEIHGDFDLDDFTARLPWSGPLQDVTLTPPSTSGEDN